MTVIEELAYFCREENIFGALMFTGKWGCGKTYLIENKLVEELGKEYVIIRISLFGESSIESIHRKIQKAYFQEWMLMIGENIEIGADGELSFLKDKIKKIGSSKWAYVSISLAKKVGKVAGLDKILSLNPSECIPIENEIAGKKLILVFDDLERSNLNEVDVLGCINEYSENKQIKTIIIANEEKIIEKNLKNNSNGESCELKKEKYKIDYSEIKEKIIARTVKNVPNYKIIIENIFSNYKTENIDYKNFLLKHTSNLVDVFTIANTENIRSIKCAIQNFERVFLELQEKKVDEKHLLIFLRTFVTFSLLSKSGKINQINISENAFYSSAFEKEYPGYYLDKFMPISISDWIMTGEWNSENISKDIERIIELKSKPKPEELVRTMRLLDLDEDIIEKGFSKVIESAYNGQLNIDEYINLILNMFFARDLEYKIPSVDMNRLESGVIKCLESIKSSNDTYIKSRKRISSSIIDLLEEKEKSIYFKICKFEDDKIHMFEINKRNYIIALQQEDLSLLYQFENQRLKVFDEDIVEVILIHYKKLKNLERNIFINMFVKIWSAQMKFIEFEYENSIKVFEKLESELNEIKINEKKDGNGLKAAITENFIKSVKECIELIEKKNQLQI